MRRIKRLICAGLAALLILGGALAEDGGADEAVLQAQEQAEKEAAERAAAEKAAAEKAAAEKAAAEKAAAEKAAAEKEAAEKAAAEKAAAEKEAAEKAAAEKAAAEKAAAEKAAAEKAAAEKAAAEKAAAEKAAAEKAAAEKEAAEKAAAEKVAAEKEAAEKAAQETVSKSVMSAATESSVTEGNDPEQKNNSSDDSTDKPSDAPSEKSSGNDGDKSNDISKDTAKDTLSDDPTDAPSDDPTDTSSDDPTDALSDDSTDAPSDDLTDTPSDDPTDTSSDDPTDDPTETPTPGPTPTPTPAPTQISGEVAISAAPSEGLTLRDGAYQVSPRQSAVLTLSWSCSCPCDGYSLRLSNGKNAVYSGQQSEAKFILDLSALQSGSYVFIVDATLNCEVVARGQYAFAVAIAKDGQKGGKGGFGGGHGGGGKSGSKSGGKSSGGAGEEEPQGFAITPGTALSSTHTSGTRNMTLYGTLALALSEDEMTTLTLDDTALDIDLNDGADGFTACLDDATLALTPVGACGIWRLNGRALRVLSDSGILSLSLETGIGTIVLSTDIALTGEVYARLRAAGYVSSDFEYRVSADGITVSVAGMVYRLEASGALTPLEGE